MARFDTKITKRHLAAVPNQIVFYHVCTSTLDE